MSAAPLSLVVLAAGLGSRFGGLKQLEEVGPGGARLMDFSIADAVRAGFGRVVFVIRPELAETFTATILPRYRRLPVAVVHQRVEDLPPGGVLPPGRVRPWGTGQAVLATRKEVPGPFAVVNADDFYGGEALTAVADFLRSRDALTSHAVVGYRLDQTASEAGGVNRAVLERHPDGRLARITEVRELVQASEGRFRGIAAGAPRIVAADALVSMNLWAFAPTAYAGLAAGFERFLATDPGRDEEYCLPDAVEQMLREQDARVLVLPTASRWCGVTYAADRERVREVLAELIERGDYPELQ